ncbi:MAG: peptidoglycan-binding protein [Clostridia bacterium]|nr:peptidoglycan-binding protein [Clostridia bacterium]
MPPTIPTDIVVHLGAPSSNAQNVTVPFADYIKNVASSEIFSTWNDAAIRANVLAQISFALNRVYTEWYRAMGYDFDITNNTGFDQSFVPNRNIYENISRIVDDIFNDYLRREGTINPLFTPYCDGVEVSCDGLSQWGSQSLASTGYSDVEILRYYYGDNIEVVVNAPIAENVPSFPDTALRLGDLNENVRRMQLYLNRISANYPAIPKIVNVVGRFDENTENAVKAFQRIFGLSPDGIIGRGTWYRIVYIFDAVTRLAELDAEGIGYENLPKQFQGALSEGDTGGAVVTVQYFLTLLGRFVDFIPVIAVDGVYGPGTRNAVLAFQRYKGLPQTGEVDEQTWLSLYAAYAGVIDYITSRNPVASVPTEPFPGVTLRRGDVGPSVRTARSYLSYIADYFYDLTPLSQSNLFDTRMQNTVREFQRIFNLNPTGMIDERTWNTIADVYSTLREGQQRIEGQYPGYTLSQEGA